MSSEEDRGREAALGRGPRENYATADNLAKRQAVFGYIDPERSTGGPPIDDVGWSGTEDVLDAGCGNGMWIRTTRDRYGLGRVVGLDISPGMLRDARNVVGSTAELAVGDVQRLPFVDESFDVVLCFWMLYHVADHRAALQEVHRVLRPGGRLMATTNSSSHRPAAEIMGRALGAVTGERVERWLPEQNFTAENGESIVGRVFPTVQARHWTSAFAFRTAEPVLAALESARGPVEIYLGRPLDWDAIAAHAGALIEDQIAADGVYRDQISSAAFLCTK